MRWFIQNWNLTLLMLAANLAINLLILRWAYRDEGGLKVHLAKDGRAVFLFEATFAWELFCAAAVFVIAALILTAMIYFSSRKNREKDDFPDGRAYEDDSEYPLTSEKRAS